MTFSPSDFPPDLLDSLHPAFIEAIDKLMTLRDRPSDDPKVRECVKAALLHAPEGLRDSIVAECRKQGILPTPDFYTEDGQGLHTIEKAAQHTGLSVEAIQSKLAELAEAYPDGMLSAEARKNAQRVQ